MPEFVGLSKQEVMALMVNDANIKIKDMLKEREDASIKMIQEEMKKGDKNLWGIASLPFELIFRLQKGILDGFANVKAAFEYSYADWKDYRKHAKTNEDGTTATGDAKIFAHTLSANFQEAIYASGKSLWAGVQQVFGDDEGAKATYEDIELNAKKQDGFRAKIIREAKNENWIKATDINPNPNYFGSSQNSEIVEDYRLDSTKESYDEIFQNQLKFKEDNIKTTKVLSGKFIFGDTYDKQFGEDKMMETIMGSLESVGTIASIAAMTSFANFAGLPVNPAMFQSAYFAAHVYGGAMEEALNNGSDIQDAHVFAISNALLETAVEEISGFKFGEFGTKILGTTVFDMIGEGVEEVIGEFASGGLSYYGSGKKDFSEAPQSSKELLTDSFYAFLGGAMAAGVMGAGGKIMNSNNVNAKAQNIVEDVQKIVKFGDEKKVTAKLDKDINLLVNTLNKKNVRGIKTNKLNRDYMGGLNLEQKKQFVENIKFNKVIEEKNGVFSLSEHYINNKDTMFSVKKDGEAINKEDYGITKAVRGVDIKNKDINITQKENFTKEGKRAFDIFDDTFVPIVFYTTEDGTMDNKKAKTSVENSEAFYDAKEHLIFINEADLKGKTDAEIIQTVLKHEWTHAIENNNKNTYRQMKNSIFALIKDKDFAKIFKTKEYHNMVLQNTQHYKIEATVKINQAIKEGKKYTKDQAKKMVASEVKAKVQAEIVAYFIENFVRDSDFVSQVAIKKPNVFTAIKNAFENVEDTTFFKQTLNGNKKIIREIRNIQKLFNTATRQVAQTTHTLDFFMKHIIGEKNDPKMLFKAEILKDNTPEEIMFAIVNNVLPDGSVKIGDKVYGLSEIWQPHFFSDIDQSKLRMIEEPNKQKIADSFKFDIKKTDTYIEKLEGYVDFLDEKSAKANITIKEVRDIEKIIDILDKPLNKLYDGEVLTKKDKDLISHFMIESIYEESIKFYNENKADYIISPKNKARQNILQTVVKHLKKTSAFGAIKNRNDTVGYAYLMVENNGKGSLEEQIKSTITGLKYEINSNQALKEYFEVMENGKVEEKIIVERIEPTELSNDSFYEIAIKVSEKAILLKEKEIEETILDRQSDTDWRKEQKGLQTTIPNAEETYVLTENMIKDYFENNDINMEDKNIIKVNQNSGLSMFENLEYNDKNIVIGIPAFYKQLPTDFINEAFKVAPIVVMTLPITLDGSYKVQKRITNDAKLIYSQKFGRQDLYIQENMKRPIKTVTQIWALKSLQETKSKHNLRLLKSKQYQHSDYETLTYHTALQKELFRRADFDFFVRQTGSDTGNFDILYDRPTDNGKYLLVKAKNKKALQILLSIDYKALAETGSNVQSGFTQYDLVDIYEDFSNNMENVISDGDIQSKVRENSYKLDAKDKAELKKLFGTTNIFDNLVEVDKKGNFIPKNAKFETKYNKIKINGVEYDSDTYAINMPISSTEQDNVVDIGKGYKIVKLVDLTKAQRMTFEILKTTRVNFVMFEVDMPINSKLHRTVGFSSRKGTTNCVFLNTKFSNKSYNFLVGTLIHEHVHEIFKNLPDIANDLRLQMGKILFDANGKKTAIYDLLDTLYDGDFKKYMVQGYPTLHMSSISKIHNVLTAQNLNNAELEGANEVTAQVIGKLFGNYEGFAEILQGDVNTLVAMNQLLDKMATNSNINSNEQTILSKTLATIRDAFNVYVDNLDKKYPAITRPQTVAEQNAFIKSFSKEKYNTVADLLNKYSQERKAHIRGDAVIMLENIIYIASSFGQTVQQGLTSFKELAEEFQEFKNSIEYMLNNSNEINKIFDKKIITLKNVIKKSLEKFNILSKKNILSGFEQAQMADSLNDIQLAINELQELYGKLDSKLLELMGFQAKDLVEAKLQILSDAINQILLDYSNGKDIKKGDLVQLYTDYTTYVKHTVENIKILDENTVSLFAKVATLYRNYNDMKHQKFSNAINSVDNTLKSHLSSTRDGRAPLNELLQTIYDLLFGKDYAKQEGVVKKLIGLNQIILDTTYDVDTMREKVIPIIDKIRDTLSQEGNNIDDKHKQEIDLALLQIYTQLAIFFNDIDILKKGVEGKFKIKDSAKVEYLGRFNENKVANALKTIIKNVYTEHISVFSLNQNEDLDAYALKTVEEINSMKKPIDLFGMVTLRNFYLPQQFFRALAEATEGQVHFFRAFYEEYVKASFASSDVEAEALRSKTAHMQKYKNVMTKSKEVHSISSKFLAKTTLTEFQYKQSGIEETLNKMKAEKKELGAKYSDFRIKKLELQAEIKDLQAKYQKIKNTGTDVQKKALLQEITSKTNEVIKIKDDMKSNAILRQAKQQEIEKNSVEIKMAEAALQEAIQRKKDKKTQELEVGVVVSLLQSVKREIQMKEMQVNDESYISPTDHFEYLNIVQVSDNDLAIKKGTKTAQSQAQSFIIMAKTKQELVDYLESWLKEHAEQETQIMLDYAQERFDTNYENLNHVYKLTYGVELPRQSIFIPFKTLQSNTDRTFEIKNYGSTNLGVARGLILRTTEGANTMLDIQNIYATIDNHTRATAKYQFDRLITDYQNLLVNKVKKGTIQAMLKESEGKFGANGGIIEQNINDMLGAILGYNKSYSRLLRKAYILGMVSKIFLAIPMFLRQFISISTISIRQQLNPLEMAYYIVETLFDKKTENWLLMNNSNFALRKMNKNLPTLAQLTGEGFTEDGRNALKKIISATGGHVSWSDNAILIAAYKAILRKITKADPSIKDDSIKMEQARHQANEQFKDVLLFDVANTETAFRGLASNKKDGVSQFWTMWQGESFMQVGGILTAIMKVRNNVNGSRSELAILTTRFLASAMFSALINVFAAKVIFPRDDDDEESVLNFFLQDFFWDNIIGGIPWITTFTSLIELSSEGVGKGFDTTIPIYTDIMNIRDKMLEMKHDGSKKDWIKVVKVLESIGNLTGIPIRNAVKILAGTTRLFDNGEESVMNDMSLFFRNKTRTEALNIAVRKGDKEQVQNYMASIFKDNDVKSELMKLMIENPKEKLSFYSQNSFKKKNEDGTFSTYKIPDNVMEKYNALAQRTLRYLIKNPTYRKLSAKEKIKSIQRIINYYYGYKKSIVLKNEKELVDMNILIEKAVIHKKEEQ